MKYAANKREQAGPLALAGILLAGVLSTAGQALAADAVAAKAEPQAQVATSSTTETAPPLSVVVNKSTILRLDVAATRISVANPAVADITPINPREIYVLGKSVGSTNLIVWNKNGAAVMMDIKVTPEPIVATPVPAPADRESVEVIKGLNKSLMEF
jgi:pilus assembly protein CpaC